MDFEEFREKLKEDLGERLFARTFILKSIAGEIISAKTTFEC